MVTVFLRERFRFCFQQPNFYSGSKKVPYLLSFFSSIDVLKSMTIAMLKHWKPQFSLFFPTFDHFVLQGFSEKDIHSPWKTNYIFQNRHFRNWVNVIWNQFAHSWRIKFFEIPIESSRELSLRLVLYAIGEKIKIKYNTQSYRLYESN